MAQADSVGTLAAGVGAPGEGAPGARPLKKTGRTSKLLVLADSGGSNSCISWL